MTIEMLRAANLTLTESEAESESSDSPAWVRSQPGSSSTYCGVYTAAYPYLIVGILQTEIRYAGSPFSGSIVLWMYIVHVGPIHSSDHTDSHNFGAEC